MTVLFFQKKQTKRGNQLNSEEKKIIPRSEIPAILSNRWGFSILQQGGWTTIPNALLHNQKELELSNSEFIVLIHIISFIHHGETPAFPSIATLSERVNQHSRTVQRTITKLLKKKLLSRKIRSKSQNDKGLSNLYSIEPLVAKLANIQKKEASLLSKQKEEKS